jgi:hypothetical protein
LEAEEGPRVREAANGGQSGRPVRCWPTERRPAVCTLLRKRQVQVIRHLALNSKLLRQTKEEQTLGVDTVLGR